MSVYYILKNELDDKIVGKDFPQVDCLDLNIAHSISSWSVYNDFPLLRFKLKKYAILTDVLSDASIGGGTGFLINEKCKSVIGNCNIMNHQFLKAEVLSYDESQILNYYWLHLSEPALTRLLDYNKTIFYRTEYTFREDIIDLENYEEYESLKSMDNDASFGVEIEKICLSERFNKALDMFTFLPFDNRIYISEKLKKYLENNNITGFDIKKATNFL